MRATTTAEDLQVGAGLSEKVLEELWRKPKKELLRVGKGGVTESHVRSLKELMAAHSVVRVKLNTQSATYDDCLELASALVETGAENSGARVLGVRPNSRLVLMGDAAFIETLPQSTGA